MAYVWSYTREPMDGMIYGPKLAHSMHLGLSLDGKEILPLNHNSGLLFAKAAEREDGSLIAKSLRDPWLFRLAEGDFGVLAVRLEGEGEEDVSSKGCVLFFRSPDLLSYEEAGLWKLSENYVEKVSCGWCPEKGRYLLAWKEQEGGWSEMELEKLPSQDMTASQGLTSPQDSVAPFQGGVTPPQEPESSAGWQIEGAVFQNCLEITEEEADRLAKKLLPLTHTGTSFPEEITVSEPSELKTCKALAEYSDGSVAEKSVDWDLTGVDFEKEGTYPITGRLHQDHFHFPMARDFADPCVGRWNGKYYFIATNDADGNHTMYVREADNIPELEQAPMHLILDSSTYPEIGGLLWAPEFHIVEGELYIFHAATPGEFFREESHVMKLKPGGSPICREDWSRPMRVVKRDGSYLCEAGKEITLDMTCFEWEGEYYGVWSQRQFLPRDKGAWLYIAKLNPAEPWKLLTEPVVLSKPEYGWANNHTFVDEGPFALPREERLYLTFSSAAVDATYVVGLLTIEKGLDLLKPENWKKKNYPILTSRCVEGEFGTGHNAYVEDEEGVIWNTYHARPGVDGPRSSGIRRVHFDRDGEPVLDLTEDRDVAEEHRNVRTLLHVVK